MRNSLEPETAMSRTGESERTIRELLNAIRDNGLAQGHFLGLIHILIGRQVTRSDGSMVCSGLTFRELAALLKKIRWDKTAVDELDIDQSTLPPRDRQRYWYQAICHAGVDSPEAIEAGEELAEELQKLDYIVSAPPSS